MKTSYAYRAQARGALQGRWTETALTTAVFLLIVALCSGTAAFSEVGWSQLHAWASGTIGGIVMVLTILVALPLQYCYFNALLHLVRGSQENTMDTMLEGFKQNFSRFVPTGFLVLVIVMALSAISFGILGIIFGYAYRMVPYLMADYPELTPREALETSRKMMKGYKLDLFLLDMSFIGWLFLGILTCGIGLLWVEPYIYTATAHFYEDLKADRLEEGE